MPGSDGGARLEDEATASLAVSDELAAELGAEETVSVPVDDALAAELGAEPERATPVDPLPRASFPPAPAALPETALVAYLPRARHDEATSRLLATELPDDAPGEEALPPAVDLIAHAMSAGLDFSAAIRHVIEVSHTQHRALTEELAYVTRQMSLGVARRRALEEFAQRVPIEPVRHFVGATQQSEEKGTPLAETLKQQAATLRNRRSVQGEEAASRAAVLMMVPLLLVMASILVVLMSPFLIRGMDAGL